MNNGRKKFEKFIKELKLPLRIVTFSSPTRTAEEAAQRLGCQVAQIAKSIVFKTTSGKPILVIASGINRIEEAKLSKIFKEKVCKADADFVKESTGYLIGGVPPFGHINPIITFIDKDLFNFSEIWAAGGDQFSVFKISPLKLKIITKAKVKNIKKEN